MVQKCTIKSSKYDIISLTSFRSSTSNKRKGQRAKKEMDGSNCKTMEENATRLLKYDHAIVSRRWINW